MTKQQKIGATILIGLLVAGIVFKFYNPIISIVWLLAITFAVFAEIQSKNKVAPSLQDIQKKYPKRKSQEQIKLEKLKERQDAYNRDLANRMKARGIQSDSAKYKKLLAMLGGDRATADRLISAYGIDKAISDLERDRRIN